MSRRKPYVPSSRSWRAERKGVRVGPRLRIELHIAVGIGVVALGLRLIRWPLNAKELVVASAERLRGIRLVGSAIDRRATTLNSEIVYCVRSGKLWRRYRQCNDQNCYPSSHRSSSVPGEFLLDGMHYRAEYTSTATSKSLKCSHLWLNR